MSFDLKRKIRDLNECWSSYLELLATCKLASEDKKVLKSFYTMLFVIIFTLNYNTYFFITCTGRF